jgi:uncharacterized protein (DUF305 family)
MSWSRTIVAMLALLLATGCAAAADSEATYAEADVSFNHEMITHHHQTIQLAEVGAERGGSSYVRELSKELIAKEQADIKMMASWLQSWEKPVPAAPAASMGAELKAGSGFDKQWLTALSGHLEHGVHMAGTVRKTGKHGPTLELAAQIIKNQNAELAEIAKRLA